MKIILLLILPIALFCPPELWAQAPPVTGPSGHTTGFDSAEARPLAEVIIKAYEQNRKLTEVGAPVAFIGKSSLMRYSNTSILPALNSVPGVRMEERSPGSYRLNIRGSTLRSPFGVRDIKIYWNEIPLTDPGGNTYLNQLGFYNVQSMEVIKGTAGSLYGAGIGGALLINSMPVYWQKDITVDAGMGSYNTSSFNANLRLGDEDHRNSISYTHQHSDGYRVQTEMRRDIASWETLLKFGERQSIHAYMLYGDLYYQTPGALTLAEYNKDPRAARPPVGNMPGAVQSQAAIFQKNFTAGFSHEYRFSDHWLNTTAVYGAYTDFTNPGIRVYEYRQEPHFGGRSVTRYKLQRRGTSLQVSAGVEAQRGFFETRDYANKRGNPDTLQTDDRIGNWQYMIFAQADLRLPGGWTVTGGASFNKTSVNITRENVLPAVRRDISIDNKLAPRISVLKKIIPGVSLYGSAARGFSTPTAQELEKSAGVSLQPEDGIDYEIGARGTLPGGKLFFDVNTFFFHLHNTIVERIDAGNVSYYINAGGTDQHGLESFLSYQVADQPRLFLSNLRIWASHTWHNFHYRNFKQDTSNFSGKRLPGVPPQTLVTGMDLALRPGIYANMTFTYAEKIALNDANTAYAGSYNLLGGRIGYRSVLAKWCRLDIFGGVDNLFNTRYSLGNDINAALGRYYNAAPGINYFCGLSVNFR